MTIREIIKERRIQLGLTQNDIARAVDSTTATVSRWESGDIGAMKRDKIKKLADVLQLDPYIFVQEPEVLMPEESRLLIAYRNADDTTKANVRKLLDIPEEKNAIESSMG